MLDRCGYLYLVGASVDCLMCQFFQVFSVSIGTHKLSLHCQEFRFVLRERPLAEVSGPFICNDPCRVH